MSAWVSVDERLPPVGKEVLCASYECVYVGTVDKFGQWGSSDLTPARTDYWMEFPDPPPSSELDEKPRNRRGE